ncbi:putative lipid II flippase FtsW [Nocardioides sp. Kera G14]|uniref:putative lipid II flippase FtsW n=1 Tax=Nocardioides sp. Kera G14 TaxID=2884264 RepID=UPI001D12A139|nr:putative lipid II flippase FtsW [Nocardioides sp. Kera G14]UDY22488.1 putative lipid II flippase FtsW [Nocardioides sp. Kera G14]
MTTVSDETAVRPALKLSRLGEGLRRLTWFRALGEALDRPLTNYYLLLVSSALLLTIGLIMVLSASSVYSLRVFGNSYSVVERQLIWVAIGLPAAWIATRLPLKVVRGFAYPAFGLSLALLGATIFAGHAVNGNQNWLGVGPFQIQPSEIAKLAIVIWGANIFANKERRLASQKHMLLPFLPGMLLAFGLVMAGNDLGTALVFAAIAGGLLWVVGMPLRTFGIFAGLGAVGIGTLAAVSPTRVSRLANFGDPFKDFQGAGWQQAHGLFALSSGGWFGEGIGASQQKWGQLPEAHTDFIFAVLGEELGLIGTLLVIGLFLVIAFAAIRVARHTAQPFVRYLIFGVVVWLVGQMIINVGMVLAVLPVIGIPLPLVSYGGSALVPSLVALGLMIGAARREPEAARALAARRKQRSAGLSVTR